MFSIAQRQALCEICSVGSWSNGIIAGMKKETEQIDETFEKDPVDEKITNKTKKKNKPKKISSSVSPKMLFATAFAMSSLSSSSSVALCAQVTDDLSLLPSPFCSSFACGDSSLTMQNYSREQPWWEEDRRDWDADAPGWSRSYDLYAHSGNADGTYVNTSEEEDSSEDPTWGNWAPA